MTNIAPEQQVEVMEAFYRQNAEIARREAAREAEPTPSGKEDALAKWRRRETWTPLQAALLVCGFEPDTYRTGEMHGASYAGARRLSGGMSGGPEHFARVHEIVAMLASRKNPESSVEPDWFVQWCNAEGIDTGWIAEAGTPWSEQIPERYSDEQLLKQFEEEKREKPRGALARMARRLGIAHQTLGPKIERARKAQQQVRSPFDPQHLRT